MSNNDDDALDVDMLLSEFRKTIESLENKRKNGFDPIPTSGSVARRRYPVCANCGGFQVEINMPCTWSHDDQDWFIERYEGSQFCHDCDEYVTLKWKRDTPPWNKEDFRNEMVECDECGKDTPRSELVGTPKLGFVCWPCFKGEKE